MNVFRCELRRVSWLSLRVHFSHASKGLSTQMMNDLESAMGPASDLAECSAGDPELKAFDFFRLPAELRERIYKLALQTRFKESCYHLIHTKDWIKVFYLGLPKVLHASRRFRYEAWPVFLKVNTLVLHAQDNFITSSPVSIQPILCHLRTFQLSMTCKRGNWLSRNWYSVVTQRQGIIFELTKDPQNILCRPKKCTLRFSNHLKTVIRTLISLNVDTSQTEEMNGHDLIRVGMQVALLVKGASPALESREDPEDSDLDEDRKMVKAKA